MNRESLPEHVNGIIASSQRADEDLDAQLRESKQLQEEAQKRVERVDEKVSEMTRMLRRIANAIDRNPDSWDKLFSDGARG